MACSAVPTPHARCRIPVPSLSSESNRRTIRDAASADKTPVRAAVTESSDNNASANLERNSTSSNHLRGRNEGGRVKPSRTDDAVVEGNTQAACDEFAITTPPTTRSTHRPAAGLQGRGGRSQRASIASAVAAADDSLPPSFFFIGLGSPSNGQRLTSSDSVRVAQRSRCDASTV